MIKGMLVVVGMVLGAGVIATPASAGLPQNGTPLDSVAPCTLSPMLDRTCKDTIYVYSGASYNEANANRNAGGPDRTAYVTTMMADRWLHLSTSSQCYDMNANPTQHSLVGWEPGDARWVCYSRYLFSHANN